MPTKVFLSSTGDDLGEYREAVIKAIELLDEFECVAMERFGARETDPMQHCREQIQGSDVFVGILGHYYGSRPPGSELSFTELEYGVAEAANVPRLMFLAHDTFAIPHRLWEASDYPKQKDFRDRVSRGKLRGTFLKPDELALTVATALHNWQVGRVHRMRESGLPERIPLPLPSFSQGFPLQNHFTGRQKERALLSRWLTEGPSILALGGFGGMGKSSLTWVWLWHDVLGFPLTGEPSLGDSPPVDVHFRPNGTLWWSFYERDRADFSGFLREALRYLNASEPPTSAALSHADVDRLVRCLVDKESLLVLDGFERLLDAYRTEGAPSDEGVIDFRRCGDPLARYFLEQVVRVPLKSRLLLSTRIFPRELEHVVVCRFEELRGLDPIDAVTFLRRLRVSGTEEELRAAGEQWGFHPLSLRLLAGALVHDPELAGHVRHAPQVGVARLSDGPENRDIRKLTKILKFAYDRLRNSADPVDDSLRDLMRRLSAFQSAVPFERIAGVMTARSKATLKVDLRALLDRGLISYSEENHTYDLHPSVRRFCYDQLRTRESTHEEIWGHLAADTARTRASSSPEDSLDDAYETFHQAAKSGRYDRALNILEGGFFTQVFHRRPDYRRCQELLAVFFPANSDDPQGLEGRRDRAWILNAMGLVCARTGSPERSRTLLTAAAATYSPTRDRRLLAIALGNLARTEVLVGDLTAADQTLTRRRSLLREAVAHPGDPGPASRVPRLLREAARRIADAWTLISPGELGQLVGSLPVSRVAEGQHKGDAVSQGLSSDSVGLSDDIVDQMESGTLQALRGDGAAAEAALARAEDLAGGRAFVLTMVDIYRARAQLLSGKPETAYATALRALTKAQQSTISPGVSESAMATIDWALGVATIRMAEAAAGGVRAQLLEEADRHLVRAFAGSRNMGAVDLSCDVLSAQARWYLAMGNLEQARRAADLALGIAGKGYRFKHADALSVRALVALQEGDRGGAKALAEKSLAEATGDGSAAGFAAGVGEARGLLTALAAGSAMRPVF